MRKLALMLIAAVAVLGLVSLQWAAQSMALPAQSGIVTKGQASYPVEKAACGRPGPHCRAGFTWTCGPRACWCRRCW